MLWNFPNPSRTPPSCRLSLEALKESVKIELGNSQISPKILQAALQRLIDYNEDARVELEICAADEELVVRGYKTLLPLPGRYFHQLNRRWGSAANNQIEHPVSPSMMEVEAQIKAFAFGEEPSVQKAYQSLTQKLADIEHDISLLFRARRNPPNPDQWRRCIRRLGSWTRNSSFIQPPSRYRYQFGTFTRVYLWKLDDQPSHTPLAFAQPVLT